MMRILHIITWLCCLFYMPATFANDNGTLIVSYSTGEKAERLDRIRFSLTSENNEEEMYPKGDAFVKGSDTESHLVVIENLTPGDYILRFLIPNFDNLFEIPLDRTVKIDKNKMIRIDQQLNPRYSTIKIKTELLPEESSAEITPVITLEDSHGNVRAHSLSGKLVAHYLVPGTYFIKFGDLPGFETPPTQTLQLSAGEHVNHILGTYLKPEPNTIDSQEPVAQSFIRRRPSGVVIINQVNAQLTVTNNQPTARWNLLRNNSPVYEGMGSVTNLQVLDGDYFTIIPEEIEGYQVRVSPASFSLYPAQTMRVAIAYERSIGSLSIQAAFPVGETLSFTLRSPNYPPSTFKVQSKTGKIFWQSQPLESGNYEVTYSLPINFEPAPPERFFIPHGKRVQLLPKFIPKSVLRVITNIPDAIFVLSTLNGTKEWGGEGREYIFTDMPPGVYKLSFSTLQPDYYIPPKEMTVPFNDKETKEVNVKFQIAGKLNVRTNIDRSRILVQEIGGARKTYDETISDYTKSFNLPEGRYKITLSPLREDKGKTANLRPPDPIEITVKPLSMESLNLNFVVSGAPVEKQRTLNISAGISAAGYTIYKLKDGQREFVGHYSGKNTQITLPLADEFEVVFDEVPNYQTPENATVIIKAGEEKSLETTYTPLLAMVTIPNGKAIIGDAGTEDNINTMPAKIVYLSEYSIGVYEVTNAEYAAWLNQAIKTGTIAYVREADNRGQVINLRDQLLFKTFEADPNSQISAQLQSNDIPLFMPLAGKDSYPLINVTWYGAQEYCKDNKCRLPTEAEWEKAAGMERESQAAPLRKFRFGFGRDEIDPTWANYKDNIDSIQHFKVLTTPVGFYNGTNVLPLSIHMSSQKQTNLAKSPYGAFDMSGNVWEWVSDWYDDHYYKTMSAQDPKGPTEGTEKVVKGGCYDSLADGVRVSERMGLSPDYCDAYTGFRIAK